MLQPSKEFITLQKRLKAHLAKGQYEEADRLSQELLQLAETEQPDESDDFLPAPRLLTAMESEQRSLDLGQLKMLATFYYVYAGCVGLGLIAILLYSTMLFGAMDRSEGIYPLLLTGMLGWNGLRTLWSIKTAKALSKYERPPLILPLALSNCLDFPMGTVLSVSTLIVMKRPSVREIFADSADTRMAIGRN